MRPFLRRRRAPVLGAMRVACLLGCLGAAALAACFGGSNDAPSTTTPSDDSGTPDGSTTVVETGADVAPTVVPDATAEAALPIEAAADAPASEAAPIAAASPDAGTLTCPGDLSGATYLASTTVSGPPPAFTGGTIPDGTYTLTAAVDYDVGTGCSSGATGDAAPRMTRGAITVSAGMLRFDLQVEGDVDQCFVGTIGPQVSTDAGTFLAIFGIDGGSNFGLSYSLSSDGLTVTAGLGSASCSSGSTDGSSGTTSSSVTVGTFVRP